MDYLDPPRLRRWYEGSLAFSGYTALGGEAVALWTRLVERGLVSVPPGLVASLAERVTHRPSGPRGGGRERHELESDLLLLVARGEPFSRLEGELLLAAGNPPRRQVERVVERLLAKLGQLYHPRLFFAADDIPPALEATRSPGDEVPEEDGDSPEELLEELYREAIRHWIDTDGHLDADDLFEIQHPHLFTSPASRGLYRKLQAAARGIRRWLSNERTLREEGQDVVQRYGEPQVLPVGGFDSFTRRGSLTALVPSQLALIEPEEELDLFDYRYLEKELLYFKREEGLVFRIRRTVVLSLRLTPGVEHERYLALLLGFCLTFFERVFDLFTKDVVRARLFLHGYVPTELEPALHFFRHFLAEGSLTDHVDVEIGRRYRPEDAEERSQRWVIGDNPLEITDVKELPFTFPDANRLADLVPAERYRLLGDEIEALIERMVDVAHR